MTSRDLIALFFSLAVSAGTFPAAAAPARVRTGIDVLVETRFQELRGKRIGLLTNQTGKNRDGKSDAELLSSAPGVTLAAIFSPEHGFAGTVEEGSVSSGTFRLPDDRVIPLFSLYGSTLAPTPDMLSGLNALVFDIQDIGARFYTYSATMGLAMQSAAAAGLDFYVLDRPNPLTGNVMEGPILIPSIRHLTAFFPVPVRHGLTIGEIARLHASRLQTPLRLHVIAMKGWNRKLWYDQTGLPWIRPSPNMPDLDSALLYSGIGCFESTNLSVGRGTPHPFLWIGAPWLDAPALLKRLRRARLKGVTFQLREATPDKSLYAGQKCRGISLQITDRGRIRPMRIFAYVACALRDLHPKDFEVRWDEIRRMVGTDEFGKLYESGAAPSALIRLFDAGPKEFARSRRPFLLY